MKRFLIKREMAGAGDIPKHELNAAGKGSEEVLEAMRAEGKNIQQEQSYVVGEAIFCVYNADSEDLIKEHSTRHYLHVHWRFQPSPISLLHAYSMFEFVNVHVRSATLYTCVSRAWILS